MKISSIEFYDIWVNITIVIWILEIMQTYWECFVTPMDCIAWHTLSVDIGYGLCKLWNLQYLFGVSDEGSFFFIIFLFFLF